jgi:DNA processing protein
MTQYYIWLLSVMGAANPRTIRLISRFGGVKEAYEALTSGETNFLKPQEAKALKKSSLEKSLELIEWCSKRNYNIITLDDTDYPESLKHIFNPPILLFTEGDLSGINSEICINVIGTRAPSEYSCKVAAVLCGQLAGVGIVIVSGMAVGLDKCAMTAALGNCGSGKRKVVGVLACGIDVEYPRGSNPFRKSVAESGGVCVSELMPRDSTRPAYFQQRNRIMSGMSSGTLVIEAGERSGCHITAMHAISQNRDLFCVPPRDIFDPRYSGVARYLRDGAIPVFSHTDIINEYLNDVCERLSESATSKDLDNVPSDSEKPKSKPKTKSSAKKPVKTPVQPEQAERPDKAVSLKSKTPLPQPAPKSDYSKLPEEHLKITEALRKKKLTFDEIIKKKLCPADKACEILLDMELDGLIEKIAGDRYAVIT